MSPAEVEAAHEPLPMEEFDLVDLGSDYGQLTVFELVGYYLDNPPAPPDGRGCAEEKALWRVLTTAACCRVRGARETPAAAGAGDGSRSTASWPIVLLAVLAPSEQAVGAVASTHRPETIAGLESPVFVDTRDAGTCAGGSVEGALCMEPSLFLHPDGTAARFRDINWLAGTFGLDSLSTAIVFGDDESDNDFVAGILFLLGHSRIVIWRGGPEALLETRKQGAGRQRGILRSRFIVTPMRDEYIALDDDVRRFFASGPVVRLDYPNSFEEAGWLGRPARDAPLLYRRAGADSLLLLAGDARAAVAHLIRLLLRDPAASVRVHLDGLRWRSVATFGAPGNGIGGTALLGAALGIVALLGIVLAIRARAGRR